MFPPVIGPVNDQQPFKMERSRDAELYYGCGSGFGDLSFLDYPGAGARPAGFDGFGHFGATAC